MVILHWNEVTICKFLWIFIIAFQLCALQYLAVPISQWNMYRQIWWTSSNYFWCILMVSPLCCTVCPSKWRALEIFVGLHRFFFGNHLKLQWSKNNGQPKGALYFLLGRTGNLLQHPSNKASSALEFQRAFVWYSICWHLCMVIVQLLSVWNLDQGTA